MSERAHDAARSQRSILVVDDDPGIRRAVGRLLRSAGFDVEIAASGEAALAALDGGTFSIALIDIAMRPYYWPRRYPAPTTGDDRDEWTSPGRGGVDTGTGARWTDAESVRDALVLFLSDRMR